MKRYVSIFLVLVLVLSVFTLGACGIKSSKNVTEDGTHIFNSDTDAELGQPGKTVNPDEVYKSMEYDYRSFFGSYRILGGEDAELEYAKSLPMVDCVASDYKITSIPYRFECGNSSNPHTINNIKNHNFMNVYFYTELNTLTFMHCAYTVEDNKLILNPVEQYEYDDDNNKISYKLSDQYFEYNFEFKGRQLTLSDGSNSVTMYSGLDVTTDDFYVYTDNYLSEDSQAIDEIDHIYLYWDDKELDGTFSTTGVDYTNSHRGVAAMSENGLLTFTVPYETGAKTYQFVYIYCGRDGIILADNENIYYYNETYSDRYCREFSDNISIEDKGKLESMSEEKLQEIAQKKTDLVEDLANAYSDAGIDVVINKETGEIIMDSSVLFAVNEAEISSDGKSFLKKFVDVYTSVVFDEKYESFVSKIMVEGHTDTSGDYDMNLELSQKRADNVKTFCLSDECGVSAEYRDALESTMVAVGYSYDNPIYDENGEVDMDASRRVSFRFIINLD